MKIKKQEVQFPNEKYGTHSELIYVLDDTVSIQFATIQNCENKVIGIEINKVINKGDFYKYACIWSKYDYNGTVTKRSENGTELDFELMDNFAKVVCTELEKEQYYIRFGTIPKRGHSKNYATGQYENGVSCYEAEYEPLEKVWRLSGGGLAGAALLGFMGNYDKIYLVKGEYVGTGSDDEPLIKNVKIISELKINKEKEGMEEVEK